MFWGSRFCKDLYHHGDSERLEIQIWYDRDISEERAAFMLLISDIVVYLDASGRQGHLGATVAALDSNLEATDPQKVQVDQLVHIYELIGIIYAISLV
jgi:hypothetical protein